MAERYTVVGAFVDKGSSALDPTVARIISAAREIPAHQLFVDQAELARLRERAMAALGDADALLLPTAPGHPTLAEVAADPIGANARLGRFTNSTNLFGLCALAVPASTVDGLPFGIMLIARAGADPQLGPIARLLPEPMTRLAVFGAHLSGQPLNPHLRALGAELIGETRTAPTYHLHALATTPPKPGLVRVAEGGAAIAYELWQLPLSGLGTLVSGLPRTMAIGSVELADGSHAPGFLCETVALADAQNVTSYGGWRAHIASR